MMKYRGLGKIEAKLSDGQTIECETELQVDYSVTRYGEIDVFGDTFEVVDPINFEPTEEVSLEDGVLITELIRIVDICYSSWTVEQDVGPDYDEMYDEWKLKHIA